MDDIPVAQRRSLPPPVRPGRRRTTLISALVGGVAVTAFLTLVPSGRELALRWLQPPPVEGLDARPTADGRLLGHFPYPEADPEMLVSVAPGQLLHRDAARALDRLQQAAAADGIAVTLLSGFRSRALQEEIFFEVKAERNQNARERAEVSAPPGYSEHSTGYAVDLGDGRLPHTDLSTSFEDTPAFRWLRDNAARYHFALSFPRDNAQGVSYEPWHWRFEGTAEALQRFEPAQRLGP